MKVIALVFNYDLNILSSIGRHWAKNIYKNKDFIFEYSAACYATFIDKNPVTKLEVFTDDIFLLKEKLLKYKINHDNVIYYDYNERLKKYVELDYSFRIAFDYIKENHSNNEYTVKIDNDMIFLDSIPDMSDTDDRVLVWKKEHYVANGNPLWGEIKVCENTIKDINFWVYNMGLMGLPINFELLETESVMNEMINVDISDVTDVNSKIYHCCEQTAWNWIFNKYKYEIIETHQYVKHHFDVKENCINDAKYLII